MKRNGMFFYRLEPAKLLSKLITMPESERGAWITQIAVDLSNGNSDDDFAKSLIEEANLYSETKRKAVEQRWNKVKQMDTPEIHVNTPVIGCNTRNRNSNIESKDKTLSSSADEAPSLLTRKKKKLTGKRLETFLQFWEAFGYKQGKAEAADAWLEIPQLTESIVFQIIAAAAREARNRPALVAAGKTPKMAQGWLSGRRWEDEAVKIETSETQQSSMSPERRALTRKILEERDALRP